MSFGRVYNFKLNFFEQLSAMLMVVPQPALTVTYPTIENCDYISGASFAKNCYLSMLLYHAEDVFYSFGIFRSRDCVDCVSVYDSELCYDSVVLFNCYGLRHSFNCRGCRESAFLWNCVGCDDCFGCVNLRNNRFCFFNEQLSEVEYKDRMAKISLSAHSVVERWKSQFRAFAKKQLQPSLHGLEVENSSGDFISYCNRAQNCFDGSELEDCVNCLRIEKSRDCIDFYSWGSNCELIARTTRCGYDSQRIRMSVACYLGSSDLEYCFNCIGCTSCFACVGLRKKQNCIFNRQYSASEYQDLRLRIIHHMQRDGETDPELNYGELLPYRLSPFAYNESDAQLLLPLSKAQAEARGAEWEDEQTAMARLTDPKTLPDRAEDTTLEDLTEPFSCISTGQPYRITLAELKLHQRLQIPLPRKHWKQRIRNLSELKNFPLLHEHSCEVTGKQILSSYAADEGWLVCDYEAYLAKFAG